MVSGQAKIAKTVFAQIIAGCESGQGIAGKTVRNIAK